MNNLRPMAARISVASCLTLFLTLMIGAASLQAQSSASKEISVQQVAEKAINFLRSAEGQDPEDGSYSSFAGPAVTALVTTAILRHGVDPSDDTVAKSLAYLKKFVQPDGGIYKDGSQYKNYETSLAILCFVEANKDGRFDAIIENAVKFTKGSQWATGRSIDESDDRYGGFGYGKHQRPDLSNTSYAIDALIKAGVDPKSPEMQRALKFVSRAQNLESAHNDLPLGSKNPDGGFIYTPAGGGESKVEGTTANGGLRSYGSMTYAGLKSMLYAGVDKDDTRVKAAILWLQSQYNLQQNPGMGSQGLYYYYHIFAKALDAYGEDTFIDEAGVKHDWRNELLQELAKRQGDDGSFVNKDSDRWLEGDPRLVTGYALLALAYCKKDGLKKRD